VNRRFLPAGMLLLFSGLLVPVCTGEDKLVFSCDFSDKFRPQTCVQPCDIFPKDAKIVDVPGGKALRVGKDKDGRLSRVTWQIKKTVPTATLPDPERPFPMRFGRLEFQFRPVDWRLGDPPFNMMLIMRGPRQTRLHITYTRPGGTGLPSIQASYGQNGNRKIGKGQLPSLFPYIDLDGAREWHDVRFEWTPAMLKLTVDGHEKILSTRDLAAPEGDFYATGLILGGETAKELRGLTDIRNVKIFSTRPKAEKAGRTHFPEVSVPPVKAPVIDGAVSQEEWSSAAAVSGFESLPRGIFAGHQPVVHIGYDEKNLYFAVVSSGHDAPPRARHTSHDANIWEDDNFELHIDPAPETPDHFQLTVNSAGIVFDQHIRPGRGFDECRRWDCRDLETASRFDGGTWTFEAKIPFSSLGAAAPRPGDKWLFNVCQTLPGSGLYSLAAVQNNYREHDRLGILTFRSADAPRVKLAGFGDLTRGNADLSFGAPGVRKGKTEVTAMRFDETAGVEFPLFSETGPLRPGVSRVFSADSGKLGKTGTLYVNLFEGRDRIYAGRFRYEISDAAEIEFLRRIVKDGKNFLLVQSVQAAPPGGFLLFEITDKAGKAVLRHKVPAAKDRCETLIPLSDLAEGDHMICLHLLDRQGATLKTAAARPFTVFGPKLPWTGCRLGITDGVPAPWVPLQASEEKGTVTVRCWNRTYTFGSRSLFAEGIRSGGTEYLTEPVRLLVSAGKPLSVSGISAKLISADKRTAVVEMTGEIPGLGAVRTTASVEYDGFIWYDLELRAGRPAKIDALAVELKMPVGASTLLNSGYRTLVNTGKTPENWSKKLDDTFGPFWIGNETGGLSFGIESAENWCNRDPGRQAAVTRDGEGARVVLSPVDAGIAIKDRLTWGFYIHPTPVRPRPAVFHTMRCQDWFGHNRELLGKKSYPPNLSYWMTGYHYQGTPAWETDRKRLEKNRKERMLHWRPYFHYDNLTKEKCRSAWYADYSSIGRNSPETIWCGESWRSGNEDKLYGSTLYGYYDDMIEVCKTPDYCDFYLWRFDRSRKQSPVVDGIYLDLMFWPACTRADHGHGYVGADGKRHPTWAVREHRRWLERIYVYCHEQGKGAPVITHMSGATSRVAGFSFADYYTDGELWSDVLVKRRSYRDMKLDQLRAEILPSIYGPGLIWISQLYRIPAFVPVTQRKNWRIEPFAERHMAGMLLLHEVVPDRSSQFDTAWSVWKALDRFGFAESDVMLPYWKKDTGIGGDADSETLAVTGYLKGKEKVLLVVFNNRDVPVSFRIALDTGKLFGRKGKIRVADLERAAELHRGAPDFSVSVPLRDFVLLEAKPLP